MKAAGDHAPETIEFALSRCSLGVVLVARSERGICATLLGDGREELLQELQERFPTARLNESADTLEPSLSAVVAHIEDPGTRFDLPLDMRGTEFQKRVWDALMQIPAGETLTYAELAGRIGSPDSTRAVAGACAANALAVLVPCHRVVRTDGGLSGYRWGLERKKRLLETERGTVPIAWPTP